MLNIHVASLLRSLCKTNTDLSFDTSGGSEFNVRGAVKLNAHDARASLIRCGRKL